MSPAFHIDASFLASHSFTADLYAPEAVAKTK